LAEIEYLEVLVSVLALLASADDESNEGADDEVDERPHRPIVPGLSERESGSSTPRGSSDLNSEAGLRAGLLRT
jgi:hypothetical protein